MASPDTEIDRLYQLPLAEFTAARNALAKRLGKPGAGVKKLQKPNVAAWAVNQLYWHRRPAFTHLLQAADKRRAAHAKLLSGKGGDVTSAESAHQAALQAALAHVRELIALGGETMSPATLNAVTDTLQGLPGAEAPGRLTVSLKPMGLEALVGLVPKGAKTLARRSATPDPPRPTTPPAGSKAPSAKQLAAAARRADQARRKDVAALRAQIRHAKQAERQAEKALKIARQGLERAQREHERLRHRVQFALKQIQDGRDEVAQRDQEHREAGNELAQLEARLGGLHC